ncbi:MAG: glycoside hydrolase family 5 protein [Calditrichaeota bacterium]|nr:glycoside hydrolase family 5 protein [Calditrichota bacterium]
MKERGFVQRMVLFILFSVLIAGCGEKTDVQPSAVVRVHPSVVMKPIPSGLGVNIHFYDGNENDWSMLSDAGAGIVRMDVGWNNSEKKTGHYDFTRYDTLIARLGRYDMRLVFILDYGNRLYDKGEAPKSDSALAAYGRFAGALAERYRGKPILWELWNEPNLGGFWKPKPDVDQYMKWCRAVVPAIRQADPKACIVGPASSGIDFRFLEAAFRRGLLEMVDAVTVHPYRSPRPPETVLPDYSQLRVLIKQYKPPGKIIPILSGEWGYSTTSISRELQGKFLARQWLTNLGFGIPVSIWYDWHDDGQDPDNGEHNFGTVTWDYQPKPSYETMRALISELRGFIPAGRIGVGAADDFVIAFTKGDAVKLAVWTMGLPHIIDLGKEILFSGARTELGKPRWLPGEGKIFATDAPQYITVKKPIPEWLNLSVQLPGIGLNAMKDVVEAILSHRQPQTAFGREFIHDYREGSVMENQAAFRALVFIADRLNDSGKAVAIYRLVLKGEAENLDKERAVYGLAALGVTEPMREISELKKQADFRESIAFFQAVRAEALLKKGDVQACKSIVEDMARGAYARYFLNKVVNELHQKKVFSERDDRRIARQVGFITRWWVAGPFPNPDNVGRTTAYFPEKKIDFKQTQPFQKDTARWQPVQTETVQGIIPLAKLFGRRRGVAYAYAELNLPHRQWLQFKIGSNDGVVCWVNGKKVHEHFVGRGLTVDEDKVNVRLKKGENRILLKVLNLGANWEACLRVCNVSGEPLDVSGWLATPGFQRKK